MFDHRRMRTSRGFQVFVKPASGLCNLACNYCYYLGKESLYPETERFRMTDDLLENYIIQHIEASPDEVIHFSWHGGEPTILGVEFFERVVALQRKHKPSGRFIANGIQTNGTLLDEEWCRFLAEEGFAVGISLDGPPTMHNYYRRTKTGQPSFEQAMRGYELLRRYRVATDILCVVNARNVKFPLEVYRFFKQIEAPYVSFLPLVRQCPAEERGVSADSVPAEAWGDFLSTIFDEWLSRDIGKIKVQIFEEAARTAFGMEHSLCLFRPVCGDIPVLEHNGDFYCCDHFVDGEHRLGNIREKHLGELIESPEQLAFGRAKAEALPRYCQACEVKEMCHGECPKNRFIRTLDGEEGLNYLCPGYKRFFNFCQPFVHEVAAEWRRQSSQEPAGGRAGASRQRTPRLKAPRPHRREKRKK